MYRGRDIERKFSKEMGRVCLGSQGAGKGFVSELCMCVTGRVVKVRSQKVEFGSSFMGFPPGNQHGRWSTREFLLSFSFHRQGRIYMCRCIE